MRYSKFLDLFLGMKEDRKYSNWTDWEACSVTCGGGMILRSFEIYLPFISNLFTLKVGIFSNFLGTTKRTRTCTDPVLTGAKCVGLTEQTATCSDFPCPDCKYLFWIMHPIT